MAVPETHQEVRGTEDPKSGTADLHLRREDTRSQDESEPRKYLSFFIARQAQRRPRLSPEVPLTTNTVYRKEAIWCQRS